MTRLIVPFALLAAYAAPAAAKHDVAPGVPDATAAPERVADASDRLICKRYAETGSLVRTRKVCGTKRDWEAKRAELHQLNVINSCRGLSEGGAC